MVDFDYPLDPKLIAQEPIEPRDSARLLVSIDAETPPAHRSIKDLPTLVRAGDVIVLNDTRVIPARLKLTRDTGGQVEVLLVDIVDPDMAPDEVGSAASAGDTQQWRALVRPSRKVAVGERLFAHPSLTIEIGDRVDGGQRLVRLLNPQTNEPYPPEREQDVLALIGQPPLPPYITTALANAERYQTTFARRPGSSAAPTAGLHLTPEVLTACERAGAKIVRVELCVGLDTFRPVSVDRPEAHEIHSERFSVSEETLEICRHAKQNGGRVIAIGTTSVRALESAALATSNQGRTKLFIYGDYSFQMVDVLLTNFHLPRSSLLLLVEAFVGPRWRDLYALASTEQYRFLSFGDAMILGRRS